MPAAKGNQNWTKRKTHGRRKIFRTPLSLETAAREYFKWCDANPWVDKRVVYATESDRITGKGYIVATKRARNYTYSGLCDRLKVSRSYFSKLKELLQRKPGEQNEEYLKVLNWIQDTIYKHPIEMAPLKGQQNAHYA